MNIHACIAIFNKCHTIITTLSGYHKLSYRAVNFKANYIMHARLMAAVASGLFEFVYLHGTCVPND